MTTTAPTSSTEGPSTTLGRASTTAGPTSTTHGGATATTKALSGGTIQLTDSDNGQTRSVARGTTVVVVLGSTSWDFPNPPNSAVLQQVGAESKAPAPIGTCVPGGGCGTASATYQAVGAGAAQVSASRTYCGEALLCSPDKRSYAVQVIVAG